jgi:hypothetical protein
MGTFCGLWHFFALALLLDMPVQSLYPQLSWQLYRDYCSRIIRPPGCKQERKLIIMWTTNRDDQTDDHWSSNHFVPVVIRRSRHMPSLGALHWLQWSDSLYPCQVVETDEVLNLVRVHFMTKGRNGHGQLMTIRGNKFAPLAQPLPSGWWRTRQISAFNTTKCFRLLVLHTVF